MPGAFPPFARRRFESHLARFAEEAILFGRARVTPELARVVSRDVAAMVRAVAAQEDREISALYLDTIGGE